MSSMSELVDAVILEIYGYTSTIDPSTYLSAGLDSSGLEISVSDASQFSRGVIQINTELIYIDAVDRDNRTLTCGTIAGRGVRGTTPATHAIGDRVFMSPTIPRVNAINAVEQTIRSSNGLFAVATTTIPFEAAVAGYDLPDDAEGVLSVSWYPSGSANEWLTVRRWKHDKYHNMITVGDQIEPNRDISITYSKAPTVPTQSQDFSVSGLPASCEDVIRYGAAWRLFSFAEPPTFLSQGSEADANDRNQQPAARIRVAQYLYQMYKQRLDEEIANLQSKYPILAHYGG